MKEKPKKIFVASSVKSRSLAERVVGILEDIDNPYEVEVVPWWKYGVFVTGEITLNEIIRAVTECDAGVFVFGKEDVYEEKCDDSSKESIKKQKHILSENVLVEAGMFYGMKMSTSVCLFTEDEVPVPSDFSGITRIIYKETKTYKVKSEITEWIKNLKPHCGNYVIADNHGLENVKPIFMTNKSQIERELSLQYREQGAKEIRLLNYAGTSFLTSKDIAKSYDEEWRKWFGELLMGNVKITLILTDPKSQAAVDAAKYKMYPPRGTITDIKNIISLNSEKVSELLRKKPQLDMDVYFTDVALPYAVFETMFDDPEMDHIKVDLYSPLTFNDEKRPSFMIYRKENPALYEHFSGVIDHIALNENTKKLKEDNKMCAKSHDVFYLSKEEIDNSLQKEYRQYFIGNLSRPQLLDYLEQGDLEIGTSLYKVSTADKPHMHNKTSEILYILKGEYYILDIMQNNEYVLKEGDFFVLPPNTPYASKAKSDTQVLFIKTGGNDKIEISPNNDTKKWLNELK
ncbi:MAG: nucleotide-binding protein [Clostridia bacterium]|nr:nucleotide-binding protein [Clostridia bacterium]